MKAKIPDSFQLKEVEKTIEGVSAVNLLGVWVERLARRRFDTGSARLVIHKQAPHQDRLLIPIPVPPFLRSSFDYNQLSSGLPRKDPRNLSRQDPQDSLPRIRRGGLDPRTPQGGYS
jgi:hypothetical protein